jgi:hypothetical protein
MTMTPRENLLASFSHREPEWAPWVTLLDHVNTPAFAPEGLQSKGDMIGLGLYLQERFGCDIIAPSPAVQVKYGSAAISTHREGDLATSVTKIAGRQLVGTLRTLPYDGRRSGHVERYPVQTLEDIETLKLLFEDSVISVDTADIEAKTQRLGDCGVVRVHGPGTPIMRLILQFMNLENTIMALTDQRDDTERLMETMHEQHLLQYRAIAQTDCALVGCCSDASTYLISPDMFRRYVLPRMRDYADICHAAGKRFMMHSCGHVREFLGMYREAGIDVHHYLAQPPIGNTTIADAAKEYGNHVTALVAVDPVMLEGASAEQVRSHVRAMVDEACGWQSFALITALKPRMPEKNLRAVAEALGRDGK